MFNVHWIYNIDMETSPSQVKGYNVSNFLSSAKKDPGTVSPKSVTYGLP